MFAIPYGPVRSGDLRGDPVSDRDRRRGRPAHPDPPVLQAPRAWKRASSACTPDRGRACRRAGRRDREPSPTRARSRRPSSARSACSRRARAERWRAVYCRARADRVPSRRDRQGGRDDRAVRRPGALSDPQGAGHAAARAADRQPLRTRRDRARRRPRRGHDGPRRAAAASSTSSSATCAATGACSSARRR